MDQLITPELIEELKAKDPRFKDVDINLCIEKEMRDSVIIKLVLSEVSKQAQLALEELASVNPHDAERIKEVQAKVYRARFVGQTLNIYRARGQEAEQSLKDEGENHGQEER